MRVSIMITTRNRAGELRRTIQMLGKLDPSPDEILITADGCTDDTAEFVSSALPNAKLIVNQSAIGSVASRDRMMREAKGDLVLALDDDSYPEQSHCVSPIVTIRHHYAGRARDEIGIHHRHARNEFWSTLMRCPFPPLLAMLAWRVFSQFRYACKRGWSWVVREPWWWGQAAVGFPYFLRKRKPVSWGAYRRWLSLP